MLVAPWFSPPCPTLCLCDTVGSAGAASRGPVARVPARRHSQQATAAVLAGVASIKTTTRPLRVWSESPFTHLHDLPPHGPSVMIIAAREPSDGKELQRARLAQHCMYPFDSGSGVLECADDVPVHSDRWLHG